MLLKDKVENQVLSGEPNEFMRVLFVKPHKSHFELSQLAVFCFNVCLLNGRNDLVANFDFVLELAELNESILRGDYGSFHCRHRIKCIVQENYNEIFVMLNFVNDNSSFFKGDFLSGFGEF